MITISVTDYRIDIVIFSNWEDSVSEFLACGVANDDKIFTELLL